MNFEHLNNEGNQFVNETLAHLDAMLKSGLPIFRMNISGDDLWDCYLNEIPEDCNPIFRERRLFDGNYDKNFIRRIGNLVILHPDLSIETLWDFETETFFNDTREKLANLVKHADIRNQFLEKERVAGHTPNYDEKNPEILWKHFFVSLPDTLVSKNQEEMLGETLDAYNVFKRTMREVDPADIDTVLELIADNALYRGAEFKDKLVSWRELKKKYDALPDERKDAFLWVEAYKNGRRVGFRASVIGTLIADLYEGKDLELAVSSYESKVAPMNYKRPKSLVTPSMVEDAKNTLSALGLLDTVYRRAANLTDIPSDKILFASKKEKSLDVLTDILDEAKTSTKNVSPEKAKDITVDELLKELPNCNTVELLPTAAITQNQMALTTCEYNTNKTIFPWESPLSWAYVRNDTADAITERVKMAGGNVDGDIRFSLAWSNTDDLDLFVSRLSGGLENARRVDEIWYGNHSGFGGRLDVDANASSLHTTTTPVENIYWTYGRNMPDGEYLVGVNQFNKRSNENEGFKLQVVIFGNIVTYSLPYNRLNHADLLHVKKLKDDITVNVIHKDLKKESDTISEKTFITVNKILTSPNTWEGQTGNKHLFFLTENFDVEEPVRGFFNEQLRQSLTSHRKVMEILGTKLKIEAEAFNKPGIAKGYGFSETKDASFILRLTYTNSRRELVNVHMK